MSVEIVTFGCRVNSFESQVIQELLDKAGERNLIVVNTCAVTGEAERQARQTIRRLKRDNPDRPILVTGCAAQIAPERYAEMPEVDRVLGNQEKRLIEAYLTDGEKVQVADIQEVADIPAHLLTGFEGRSKAFAEIQQGCDNRCTFCIVPTARGKNRSVPAERIIQQIRGLVESGFLEVVLTGVDVSSYGRDQGAEMSLADLVARILQEVPDLPRLRLSSLDPGAFDEGLFDLFASEERLLPYVHLSIQAGDDTILRRMARRHRRADVAALCERLRSVRPDVVLGADFIAGFPTETEEMAANTEALIKDLYIPLLHVFPYSPRPGTPAAKMALVPGDIAKERAARLRALGETLLAETLSAQIGKEQAVLLESSSDGHTPQFLPVEINGAGKAGRIEMVRISGVKGLMLQGEVL